MLTVLNAAIMNAAARDNKDVRALSDMKIVIYRLFDSALCQNDRDMNALALCSRLDVDINTGLVCLLFNYNVF